MESVGYEAPLGHLSLSLVIWTVTKSWKTFPLPLFLLLFPSFPFFPSQPWIASPPEADEEVADRSKTYQFLLPTFLVFLQNPFSSSHRSTSKPVSCSIWFPAQFIQHHSISIFCNIHKVFFKHHVLNLIFCCHVKSPRQYVITMSTSKITFLGLQPHPLPFLWETAVVFYLKKYTLSSID